MAQELLSIQELAQLRTYRMQICAQFEQSHSQDFTYALGTSLDLQGIARPKSDSCINNTVYIATHDRDKRIKYANSKWIVWKKNGQRYWSTKNLCV